jgi:hypothetical protein
MIRFLYFLAGQFLMLFLFIFKVQSQTPFWEKPGSLPDHNVVSNNVKVMATDSLVIHFQYREGVTNGSEPDHPVIYVSTDGMNFTCSGQVADSLGKIEPLFVYRNEVCVRTSGNVSGPGYAYLTTRDGIHYKEFLPLDFDGNRVIPAALGKVRDTVYAFVQSEIMPGSSIYADYLFYLNDKMEWTYNYSVPNDFWNNRKDYTVLVSNGNLVMRCENNLVYFPSLQQAPVLLGDSLSGFKIDFYYSFADEIIFHDPEYYINNNAPFRIYNLNNQVITDCKFPESYNTGSDFRLIPVADSNYILFYNQHHPVENALYSKVFETYDKGSSWILIDSVIYRYTFNYLQAYSFKGKKYIVQNQYPYLMADSGSSAWKPVNLNGFRRIVSFETGGGRFLLNNSWMSSDNGSTWESNGNSLNSFKPAEWFYPEYNTGWIFYQLNTENNLRADFYQLSADERNVQFLGTFALNDADVNWFKNSVSVKGELFSLTEFPDENGYDQWFIMKYDRVKKRWLPFLNLYKKFELNFHALLQADGENLFVCSVDNQRIINGYYASADGGYTWKKTGLPAQILPDEIPFAEMISDRFRNVFLKFREIELSNFESSRIDTTRIFRMSPDGFIPVSCNGLDFSDPFLTDFMLDNLRTFPSGNTYFWYNHNGLNLYRSADLGNSWKKVNTEEIDSEVNGIGEDADGTMYVASYNGLYRENKIATAVITFSGNSSARLYPNPATSSVTLKGFSHQNIKILNATGEILQETEITKDEITLDLNGFSSGMYFIHGTDGSYRFVVLP